MLPTNRRTRSPTLAFSAPSPVSGADAAVEHHVRRPFVDPLLHVERLQAVLAVLALGVELALHHVELADRPSAGRSFGSTRIRPYMPLAMCIGTGDMAQ